jgi:hypothetical protein
VSWIQNISPKHRNGKEPHELIFLGIVINS